MNKFILSLLGIVTFMAACQKEESNKQGTVDVVFKASYSTMKSAPATIVFTDLTFNVKEIEFDVDDDELENGEFEFNDSVYSDVELDGPFEVIALKNGVVQEVALNNFTVPDAPFKEIEFKIDVNEALTSASPMHNKSLLLKGTINGVPFIMWHDKDEEFKYEFAEGSNTTVLNANSLEFTLNLQLGQMLAALANIDLSSATDGDKDGVIEIGPNDQDGNSDLADDIFKSFKESIKAESHEDDEDDSDEKDLDED